MRGVLKGERFADVPCDGCVGCCVSSYAIPLRPSDKVALEAVPARYLRLSIPGGPAQMGYRSDGSCPLLEGRRCTIYRDRPQTCRDYDCRIYAATGLVPHGDRQVLRERVLEWVFDFTSDEERVQYGALQRAVRFIREHAALFPPAVRADTNAGVAVLAVKSWPLFANEKGDRSTDPSPGEQVARVLQAARVFDDG